MSSRTLNVTATDGEHFSDVIPIVLNFGSGRQTSNNNQWFLHDNSNNNYGVNFQCRETDVASRLTGEKFLLLFLFQKIQIDLN